VLDPFGGTGTTAHVAHALGRHGISIDLSADYCRLANAPELRDHRWRKVNGGIKPEPQIDGQGDLFGGDAA
jgi:site-specific DNA-methyltransferase (cytosine-N4-specific)